MTKNTYYMHIPLWVTVFYMDREKPMPRSVRFDHKEYKITKVISSGEAPPENATLPVRRYLVEINGVKKALYYDVKHDRWYSVKRISEEKAKEIRNARGEGFPEAYFRSVIETRRYMPVSDGKSKGEALYRHLAEQAAGQGASRAGCKERSVKAGES